MATALLATTAPPRAPALTTVIFEAVHEEGFYGRCHLMLARHPYPFASRDAASGFGQIMCERYGYDGFRLDTPGFVPPPRALPAFDDSEIPF